MARPAPPNGAYYSPIPNRRAWKEKPRMRAGFANTEAAVKGRRGVSVRPAHGVKLDAGPNNYYSEGAQLLIRRQHPRQTVFLRRMLPV